MKKTSLLIVSLLATSIIHAQDLGNIESSVDDLVSTIKKIFPLIMLVIFLIGFAFNASYFFGENQDLKKGISRVLVFVGVLGCVAGIASYILAITL